MNQTRKPSNPPAFARDGGQHVASQEGMTLRDYFAAMAMQGIVQAAEARFWIDPVAYAGDRASEDCFNVVNDAYIIADAMLLARNQ